MSSARSTYVPHAKHLHLHIKYKQDLRMYHMVSTGAESCKQGIVDHAVPNFCVLLLFLSCLFCCFQGHDWLVY